MFSPRDRYKRETGEEPLDWRGRPTKKYVRWLESLASAQMMQLHFFMRHDD